MIGPGLLGGSILKAVRKFQPECELRVWARRFEALEPLRDQSLADVADTDIEKVVAGAGLIILAMPIQYMQDIVEKFPPLSKGVVVTDVGSTKCSVVKSLSGPVRELGGVFVGSHPMAGSEKTGIDHASADLFCDAAVLVTPEGAEAGPEMAKVVEFWSVIGGRVCCIDPAEHDSVVASISHLPHLLASALVRSTIGKSAERASFAGGGFRDTTRIAGGDPGMWTEIMMDNRKALLAELDAFQSELTGWRDALAKLDKETVHRFLSEARESRGKV